MIDKKKIKILQEENARLQKELERLNHLIFDNVTGYVDEFEMVKQGVVYRTKGT